MKKEILQNLKNQILGWEEENKIISVKEKSGQKRDGIIATTADGNIKVYWSEGAGNGSDDVILPFEEFTDRFDVIGAEAEKE